MRAGKRGTQAIRRRRRRRLRARARARGRLLPIIPLFNGPPPPRTMRLTRRRARHRPPRLHWRRLTRRRRAHHRPPRRRWRRPSRHHHGRHRPPPRRPRLPSCCHHPAFAGPTRGRAGSAVTGSHRAASPASGRATRLVCCVLCVVCFVFFAGCLAPRSLADPTPLLPGTPSAGYMVSRARQRATRVNRV